ncbi:MAG: NAD-dependent DNA ligase LigA [Clostridiales Family XIII bacterium]|jgi:DNA ligase (NAD+)|nr:NAD-dependent DNA ligase LigA [Clostridiales Family XIII bacterium]
MKVERIKELIKILNEANYTYYNKNEELMLKSEYDKSYVELKNLYNELENLEKETGIILSNSPTKIKRIKELIKILNEASDAYYNKNEELISNFEYDKLYDELESLEKETGIILSNSPTEKVGYTPRSNELVKEAHEIPMLSLDKTKDISDLKEFLNDKEGVLSFKLDGLTCALTYENGQLSKALTRGDGYIGELITKNALRFQNLPIKISYTGKLILRGECIITYSDFEKLNLDLDDKEVKFKNPRNLASGSVRQLDDNITAKRKVNFIAFSLAFPEREDVSFSGNLFFLEELGFDIVSFIKVNSENIEKEEYGFSEKVKKSDFPCDGLVLTYDDIKYGKSLGQTAKFPRDSIAFKWKDETKKTILKNIEWDVSRTGLINPVAIFNPVELDGTTVKRATLHNISFIKELRLKIDDEILVYKANMIIPKLAENLSLHDNYELDLPEKCPACDFPAVVKDNKGILTLHCENEDCPAKKLLSFSHFVSNDGFNIDGLSEKTLEKFINLNILKNFSDIFKIDKYKNIIESEEGFGKKSYENLWGNINKSKNIRLSKFINALGIKGIGSESAKLISDYFENDLEKIIGADTEDLKTIKGIGDILAEDFVKYFCNRKNLIEVENLSNLVNFTYKNQQKNLNDNIAGKTFVITGSLNKFKNRDSLEEKIAELGGKNADKVNKNTDYLINNDMSSTFSKYKKAKELGTKIITEEEFIALYE